MKERLKSTTSRLPKSAIFTSLFAIAIYARKNGYIGDNELELIANLGLALGFGVNLLSGKFKLR